MLNAYSIHDVQVGYCQGMNFLAAFVLTKLNAEEEAYWTWYTVMQSTKYNFRTFFFPGTPLAHNAHASPHRLSAWPASDSFAVSVVRSLCPTDLQGLLLAKYQFRYLFEGFLPALYSHFVCHCQCHCQCRVIASTELARCAMCRRRTTCRAMR